MKRTYDRKSLEQLVVSYADVGRRQKRMRLYGGIAAIIAAPLLVFIGIQAWQYGGSRIVQQRGALDEQAEEIQAIKDSLASEIEAIKRQSREFERSRGLLLEQSEMLEQEMALASEQRNKLEAQRDGFSAQQEQMSAAIAQIEDRRRDMQRKRAEIDRDDPLLERERTAMNEERRKLEQQRKRFAEEGALLEREIQAINEQRAELAAQRVAVEKRRKELQSLLEKSKTLRNTTTEVEPANNLEKQTATGTGDEPLIRDPQIVAYSEPAPEPSPLGLPIVEAYKLDKMRGGFSIGDDMVISVGITRSGSVNGVEQFTNSINIADIASGVSPADMEGATATLIQNGPGNFVSPNVLAAMSENFTTIVQNSLDDQEISTMNIYDISVENVSSAVNGIAASQAISDSLSFSQ